MVDSIALKEKIALVGELPPADLVVPSQQGVKTIEFRVIYLPHDQSGTFCDLLIDSIG